MALVQKHIDDCLLQYGLSTILIITAAYAFSRFRFPGRRYGLMMMLVLQMFPGFMGMIAIYILQQQINLLDNLWGLILVYADGSIPFNAWLVKGYFDGLPRSLEEAAKIDGASNTKVFFRIMLPMSVPILVFVAVSNFIGPWMDFIFNVPAAAEVHGGRFEGRGE